MDISIDIGTSFSSMCMRDRSGGISPVYIKTAVNMFGNDYAIPTAVCVDKNGDIQLGQAAMNIQQQFPQNFVCEFKRNLGEETPFFLGGESFLPEELYTKFFIYFKECAEKAGGEPVDKVFITYPASYLEHDKRKRKIIGAAKAAGLFDIVLVDEPTAAAMNYLEEGSLPRDAKNLMIYDFGGGTFDVSLIRCDHGQLDLICDPGGDPECGGVDMDRAIYEDIAAAMNAQFTDVMQMVAGNPTQMKRLQFQIQEAAVKAKHQLTTGGIVQQTIPVGFDLLTYTLTRESFERMIAPLAAKSITACRNILQSANMKIEDLSAILMVGGTSRVPLVQSMLKQFAGKTPVLTAKNMDLAVVVGALKYREKPAADEKAKRQTQPEPKHSEPAKPPTQNSAPRNVHRHYPKKGGGAIIGIDLGETACRVSVIQNGVPVIIPFEDGKRSLLPAVMVTKNGNLIIGEPEPLTDSRRYLRFCKRDLCSSKCVTIGGEDYTPKRIASILIRRLKAEAEAFLGEQVTRAVITVPSYFTSKQRSEIIQAAADAGLDTRRLLNASTAVALNDRSENDRIFLVIDLGASGLEVSVAESGDGIYEVLAIAYNDRIGGAMYDQRISEWVTRQVRLQTGMDLSHDRAAQRVLLQLAEQAKIKLSAADSAEINVPASVRRGSSDLRYVLSKALFNRLTADLTASVKDCVMSAVSDSGVRMRDIDGVVFSGGASRIPAVWKELEAIQVVSARQPERILGNGFVPEQRAAVGAAVMAGMISGDIRSSLAVLDITTHSLGVETMGGVMTKLIERNTTIPIFKKQVFSTASDNQTQVELNVLQGENERAVDNIQLGIFALTGIQLAKRGIPQIEVTFSIDANGVISVGAKDLRTGQEQKITIR